MRKIYRYPDRIFLAEDDTDVLYTVKFYSNGNSGLTLVNVPGPIDPVIEDEGTEFIGKGRDLRSEKTISVSDIANLLPTENVIKICYLLNNQLLVEHINPKSEEERPIIIIKIIFPKP
jgi:hypothetical protein